MSHDPNDDVNPRGIAVLPVPGQSSLESPHAPPVPGQSGLASPHAAPLPPPTQQAAPPPPDEPFGMLDLVEPPERYFVDETTLLARDPWTLFVYWEVTDRGWDVARAALGSDGKLTLRIYSTALSRGGPVSAHGREGVVSDTVDYALDWDHGRRYVPAPRPGAHVSAAVGLVGPTGRFAPICHAPRVRVPQAEPAAEGPVEWMEVAPARTHGRERERPEIVRRGPATSGFGFVPGVSEGIWQQRGTATSPAAGELPTSPWRWQRDEEKRDGR
jgi:hypothetical protein